MYINEFDNTNCGHLPMLPPPPPQRDSNLRFQCSNNKRLCILNDVATVFGMFVEYALNTDELLSLS
jgi:hypothetical protein